MGGYKGVGGADPNVDIRRSRSLMALSVWRTGA